MNLPSTRSALVLGLCCVLGLGLLGFLLGRAALEFKALDRSVSVKGLSEREMPAETSIWPIRFQDAANELPALFDSIQGKNQRIVEFLESHGLKREEITINPPSRKEAPPACTTATRGEKRSIVSSTASYQTVSPAR